MNILINPTLTKIYEKVKKVFILSKILYFFIYNCHTFNKGVVTSGKNIKIRKTPANGCVLNINKKEIPIIMMYKKGDVSYTNKHNKNPK